MGTNRRYADSVDAQTNQRVIEILMRDYKPHSLTKDELELHVEPLTKTPVPRPVRAWVRYGDMAVKVDGEAVAWTPRAVAVSWETPDGRPQRAWLWSSAVEGR